MDLESEIVSCLRYDPGSSSEEDLEVPEESVIGTAGLLPMDWAGKDRQQGELWKLNYDEALHNLECSRNWNEQSFSVDTNLFSMGLDSLSFNLTDSQKGMTIQEKHGLPFITFAV
jgi:hypothetical protein